MAKTLSAILLFLFLFNVGGYYLVFWGVRYQADRELTSSLDANQYDRSLTVLIKIPLTLPYPVQPHDFERVNGSFEHNGQYFRLVKQKLENDTLHIVCIRDEQTKKIMHAMNDYVQRTQDLPLRDSGKGAMTWLTKMMKDFCCGVAANLVSQPGYSTKVIFRQRTDTLLVAAVDVPVPPPRV